MVLVLVNVIYESVMSQYVWLVRSKIVLVVIGASLILVIKPQTPQPPPLMHPSPLVCAAASSLLDVAAARLLPVHHHTPHSPVC